jgi:glycosyltransferase involved in cell wall biosynthesis
MKILFHHRTLAKDGQDVHIQELVAALRRAGHEVLVVGPRELSDRRGAVGALKSRLPKAAFQAMELAYSVVAFRRLRDAWRSFQPDFLYERYNLFLLAGMWLKRRYGTRLLLEVNSPLALERAEHGGLALPGLAHWLEGATWRAADAVLPVTAELARFVREKGVPDERIVVVPNGVDRAVFSPRPGLGEAVRSRYGLKGKIVLGFTGFLRPWHGLRTVIDVLAELGAAAPLHFLVVGDGPARTELEAQARARGVANMISITGVVGREGVPSHVAAFDIALQPDVTAYASPLKLFEYMALGRAIVAPNQPNIREVLDHGVNALLFDPRDPGAFRAVVERLCLDAALRTRLGAAACETIDRHGYLWDENARRVVAVARGEPLPAPASAEPEMGEPAPARLAG